MFVSQLPFIIISIIGISLLPVNIYSRNKQEKLEDLLDTVTTQLAITDERQRIARDLHDTLGQKLSLVGMKADLAAKLVEIDSEKAIKEIKDIQTTARSALKEVRDLVANMRLIKLSEEVYRVEQILSAANIKVTISGNSQLDQTSVLAENVLSMCLKEATTNIVKHSQATLCNIKINESTEETTIIIEDNGIGFNKKSFNYTTHGISGMTERLEFMNGDLKIDTTNGTRLTISIPHVISQAEETSL